MKLGMIGLGKMGANMAERLRSAGHEVVGYDPHADGSDVDSLEALADALAGGDQPRIAWSMVPAGDITDQTVAALGDLFARAISSSTAATRNYPRLGPPRRATGGEGRPLHRRRHQRWGVGAQERLLASWSAAPTEAVALAQPIFDALAPADGGFAHVGPVGAGHFTKMVHNGIEYGIMQAYAEGYAILLKSPLGIDPHAGAGELAEGKRGAVVAARPPGRRAARRIRISTTSSRWRPTPAKAAGRCEAAIETGVAAPVISAALFARFVSQDDEGMAMQVIAALRHQFGGHAMEMKAGVAR